MQYWAARISGRLGRQVGEAGLWLGTLRRLVQATSIESSTSIEGFHVPTEEAVAIVGGEASPNRGDENRMAVACYARAMEHVAVMAGDPAFRWYDRVILAIHFEACYFQPAKTPGRWRTGPIAVTDGDGRAIYQAPDADRVPTLMAEVVDWLEKGDLDAHVVVRGAMAHLHVVSVHPFHDGNGRISRIAQSLVLALLPRPAARSGRAVPARARRDRVDRLLRPGPSRPGPPRLGQIQQAAVRWGFLEQLAESRGWPDRFVIALEQALVGGTDRARYSEEAGVSPASATNDFRRLLDAGLVSPRGRGRNIRYHASDSLREQVAEVLRLAGTQEDASS